ncbi:MAG: patatin family protein [Eubacteriales bacterium]|nr:patatin family protein [Eubacteriales bacterium]
MKKKVYSHMDRIPAGDAPDRVTEGCLVLEGGAFRGLYSQGVMDVLMKAGINFRCTVGVSAGAMGGMNYVAGQIGRSARVNLRYRHDSRYVGIRAVPRNQGLIGFDFVFRGIQAEEPFNGERFFRPDRRFVAVATNCLTGEAEYFEKGICGDIFQAIRASASMPYISRPVDVEGTPCLDGGCSCKIPYQWAIDQGYEKIVVIRTRHASFRKDPKRRTENSLARRIYRHYPEFAQVLEASDQDYNRQCDELDRLQAEGRVYVISPSVPMKVGRLEKDMEKLGRLYGRGVRDAKEELAGLKEYLGIS